MARRVGYQALLVNNKACAVDELAVFCRQTEGVRLCGGGRAASCEGERLQVVVHGGEEGECGDGDVYPEVAGHAGGGGGGRWTMGRGGSFLTAGFAPARQGLVATDLLENICA